MIIDSSINDSNTINENRSTRVNRRGTTRVFVAFAVLIVFTTIQLPLIHRYYLHSYNNDIDHHHTSEKKQYTSEKRKEEPEPKPLNILLLYADDWRYDSLGSLGKSIVQTPNLDVLAKEGMLFTDNCVTTAGELYLCTVITV